MSLTNLTIHEMFTNISNAFIGTISDMYMSEEEESQQDRTIRVLMKENRFMYLALLVLLLIIVGNVFF